MRVLHLIDPASPGGSGCTLHLLAETVHRLNSIDHGVIVLGNRRHTDLARRCGVRVWGQIPAPLNIPLMARHSMKKLARMMQSAAGAFDIVHAWTVESALLSILTFPHCKRLATLSVGPRTGPTVELLNKLLKRHPMPMCAASSGVFREFESLGVAAELLSVLPPGVNPESVHMLPRAQLHERWNIDTDTFVIGLLSEPPDWADAHLAVDIIARPRAAGRNIRVVVHPRAFRRVEAEFWSRELGWHDFIITDPQLSEPWKLVNGLDMAFMIGSESNALDLSESGSPLSMLTGGERRLRPMPGIMPLLWMMAGELPVVAEASDAVRDVLEDSVNGLLINQRDIIAAADRIKRLHDDPTLAGRIGAAARQRVEQDFHISSYCVRLKDTYEHIIEGLPPHVLGVDNRPWVARKRMENKAEEPEWTMR